jgi:hypothetical protein
MDIPRERAQLRDVVDLPPVFIDRKLIQLVSGNSRKNKAVSAIRKRILS